MSIRDILITGKSGGAGLARLLSDSGSRDVRVSRAKTEAPRPVASSASRWTLEIPGWMPTPLNRIVNAHWGTASKLKAKDKAVLGLALLIYGVPIATLKRRVTLLVVLPPKKRACDPDALYKSLLDALVHCGALKNDSRHWVTTEEPRFARGQELTSFLTLEDIPDAKN